MENDLVIPAEKALERHFAAVYLCSDDLAVGGGGSRVDEDDVAVHDADLTHTFTFDGQAEVVADQLEEVGGEVQFYVVFDRREQRLTRGDVAEHRHACEIGKFLVAFDKLDRAIL